MGVEVGFGSILIPTKSFSEDEQCVVLKRQGRNSLVTMPRYITQNGRTALSAVAGTAGANKEYIKSILPEKMTSEQMIEAYRVFCEDQGYPFKTEIENLIKKSANVNQTVIIDME